MLDGFDSEDGAVQVATMSTLPQPDVLTVADYRELGEGPPHYQLIEGEIFMSPAPNRFHQVISRNLAFILMRHLDAHPIGEVYLAPFDVYLDDLNAYQPDIVYVSTERKGILEDDGAHGAPDLVVEILSPSTARLDKRKRANCARHPGVLADRSSAAADSALRFHTRWRQTGAAHRRGRVFRDAVAARAEALDHRDLQALTRRKCCRGRKGRLTASPQQSRFSRSGPRFSRAVSGRSRPAPTPPSPDGRIGSR